MTKILQTFQTSHKTTTKELNSSRINTSYSPVGIRRMMALVVILTVSILKSYAQKPDSLQEITAPKWVFLRMVHDIQTGKLCDSLVRMQQGYIEQSSSLMIVQDSLIENRGQQIRLLESQNKEWEARYMNQVEATLAEKANTKRWKLTTIIGGVLVVLLVL